MKVMPLSLIFPHFNLGMPIYSDSDSYFRSEMTYDESTGDLYVGTWTGSVYRITKDRKACLISLRTVT